jgi:hypothetical protein
MGIETAILGAGALSAAGGIFSSRQAGKAASAQAAAANQAAQMAQAQYLQTREDLAPWREVGEQALYEYADLLGVPSPGAEGATSPDFSSFYASPGYQFRQEEGTKAVERSAAARGMLQSGATLKALQEHGQNIASDEFNTYANRLSNLAGLGQTATTSTGQFGAQATSQSGSALERAGAARASGYLGQGQAAQGVAGDLSSLLGLYASPYIQKQIKG